MSIYLMVWKTDYFMLPSTYVDLSETEKPLRHMKHHTRLGFSGGMHNVLTARIT